MHSAGAAREHLPLRSRWDLDKPLPARGCGFPITRTGTTFVRTSWGGCKDQTRVPAAGSKRSTNPGCKRYYSLCAGRTFRRKVYVPNFYS